MWLRAFLFSLCLFYGGAASKYRCTDSGPCVNCAKSEILEEDCLETGRRMKVVCIYGADKEKEDFRSCSMTVEDEQNRVIVFQLLMGVCGGLAYFQVQARKGRSATLFDQRRAR